MLVAVGVLGFLGHLLLNRGVQIAQAGPAAAMRYTDVLISMLFQATVLANPPNALKLIGCALIMSSIVSVLSRQRRKAAKAKVDEAAAAAASQLCGPEGGEQPTANLDAAVALNDIVWIGKLAAHSPAMVCNVCGLPCVSAGAPQHTSDAGALVPAKGGVPASGAGAMPEAHLPAADRCRRCGTVQCSSAQSSVFAGPSQLALTSACGQLLPLRLPRRCTEEAVLQGRLCAAVTRALE
jgi:hypothetical protein